MQHTTLDCPSTNNQRLRHLGQNGFSIIEVLVVIVITGIAALAVSKLMVNQVKNSANTAQKNDLNTLVNEIQTVLNNSTTCTAALASQRAFSDAELSKQVYSKPIPVSLKVGSTQIATGQKYTNTLQILGFNFTSIDTASAGQYRIELTLNVERVGAKGVALPARPFFIIAQIDTSSKKILGCSGQFTNRWSDGPNNSIAYNGGYVGIGTLTPSSELEVTGTIKASAFMYKSDSRLKENVREISTPLEKVMRLHGITFDWRDKSQQTNKVDQLGVLAQEVEEVFPEAVNTDLQSGIKSVAYGNLVAPLIEAIKEQQRMILQQQKEIDEIKKEISRR